MRKNQKHSPKTDESFSLTTRKNNVWDINSSRSINSKEVRTTKSTLAENKRKTEERERERESKRSDINIYG